MSARATRDGEASEIEYSKRPCLFERSADVVRTAWPCSELEHPVEVCARAISRHSHGLIDCSGGRTATREGGQPRAWRLRSWFGILSRSASIHTPCPLSPIPMSPSDESPMHALTALSPLDGRYAPKLGSLRALMSEAAFMGWRVRVEVEWLLALEIGRAHV